MSAEPEPLVDGERPRQATAGERARGPALVALGAAGWGTEGLWRYRLDQRLAPYAIVLLEHALQVLLTLPWLLRNRWLWRRIPRRALGYVALSGALGSSLGTVAFTAAYATDINKTTAAVLLNLQPVVSTLSAALLFGERLRRRFFVWAPVALAAGVAMALREPTLAGIGLAGDESGYLYVALTVVLWGFATVAGRGAMRELPVGLAAPLRLWAGLIATAAVIGVRALVGRGGVDLAPVASPTVLRDLLLLTTLSGAAPLFVYFAGLARTPAAIAGYCEMVYTVSASLVAWAFIPGSGLAPHQAIAAGVLLVAVVQLNRRGAETVEAAPAGGRAA